VAAHAFPDLVKGLWLVLLAPRALMALAAACSVRVLARAATATASGGLGEASAWCSGARGQRRPGASFRLKETERRMRRRRVGG